MEGETRKDEIAHTTMDFQQRNKSQNHVALITLPFFVNVLLDDGSTKTYISDIAAARNLRREIRKVTSNYACRI